MGYSTCFDIYVGDNPYINPDYKFEKKPELEEFNAKVLKKLQEISDYPQIEDCGIGQLYVDDVNWHEWYEDMRKLSIFYPDTQFYVRGQGEEDDDLWHARFFNGKGSRKTAEIVYPELPLEDLT